jgi:hypothetical protein
VTWRHLTRRWRPRHARMTVARRIVRSARRHVRLVRSRMILLSLLGMVVMRDASVSLWMYLLRRRGWRLRTILRATVILACLGRQRRVKCRQVTPRILIIIVIPIICPNTPIGALQSVLGIITRQMRSIHPTGCVQALLTGPCLRNFQDLKATSLSGRTRVIIDNLLSRPRPPARRRVRGRRIHLRRIQLRRLETTLHPSRRVRSSLANGHHRESLIRRSTCLAWPVLYRTDRTTGIPLDLPSRSPLSHIPHMQSRDLSRARDRVAVAKVPAA